MGNCQLWKFGAFIVGGEILFLFICYMCILSNGYCMERHRNEIIHSSNDIININMARAYDCPCVFGVRDA